MPTTRTPTAKTVETLTHADATRRNIPTAEHQSVLTRQQQHPTTVRYPRNTDLDPQLLRRGKDAQDSSDLVVHAPPLYIQECIYLDPPYGIEFNSNFQWSPTSRDVTATGRRL